MPAVPNQPRECNEVWDHTLSLPFELFVKPSFRAADWTAE